MTRITLTSTGPDKPQLVIDGHTLEFTSSDAHALLGDRMTAWCTGQGLEASEIPANDFAITRDPDGQLWAHYTRTPPYAAARGPRTGWNTKRVTTLPTD